MPNFQTSRLVVAAVVAVSLASGACKKGGNSSTTEETSAAKEGEALGNKLDGYIDCYNNVDKSAHDAMRYYARWVDDLDKGPTGKERNIGGVSAISASGIKSCKDAFEAGKKKKPALADLEAKSDAYIAALEALQPKTVEANTYYDRKDYKDDKFVKAKALHAPLWAAFLAFDKASDAFSDALEVENDKSLTAEIAGIEKTSGKKLLWQKLVTGQKAKNVLHELNKEKPDAKKTEELVNDFTAHVDGMNAYAEAHADEKPTMWSSFASDTKSFVENAKERMRVIRDKTPLTTGQKMLIENGNPDLVPGTAAKLSKSYNTLVTAGNRLTFKE